MTASNSDVLWVVAPARSFVPTGDSRETCCTSVALRCVECLRSRALGIGPDELWDLGRADYDPGIERAG